MSETQHTTGPFAVYDPRAHADWCATRNPPACPATFMQSNGPGDVVRRPCDLPAGHYPAGPHRFSIAWIEPGDQWPSPPRAARRAVDPS